jgi:hypothetical protein
MNAQLDDFTQQMINNRKGGDVELICELISRYDSATDDERDSIYDEIVEYPLSIEYRSGWSANPDDLEPEEFEILLSTGGPATRLYGTLNQFGTPEHIEYQFQDWFKPWETQYTTDEEDSFLLHFATFFIGA